MTTVTQIERLVRKITEALGPPPSDTHAAKLAEEYAEACRNANRRLEQCAVMIEAGQALHALQLAETPPSLLDLITVLNFRQAAEWRAYCQAHQLPASDPFFDKYVRLLNSAYGKGIASDHPYYRDYRRAVLKNDDERALSILRVIMRMNPADENIKAEMKRVEKKLFRVKLDKLQQVVATGDKPAIVAELEKMENSGGPIPSSQPIWQQAQVARCQELLRRAEEFRRQDAWQDAEVVVDEIHTAASQYNVQLPAADADAWTALEAWTSSQRAAFTDNQNFQRAVSALEYEVQSIEALRNQGWLNGVEAQKKSAVLAAKASDAEKFGRPLDESLTERRAAGQAWLQRQIQAAQKRRRLIVASVVIVILAAIGISIPFVRHAVEERALLQQLDSFESARRVSDVEAVINQVPDAIKSKPGVTDALAKARDFVARENGLKQAFEGDMRQLREWSAAGFRNNVEQIAPRLAQAEQALGQMAPEFQPAGQSALNAGSGKWQTFRDAALGKELARAEEIASGLNGAAGPAAAKSAVARLQSILTESHPYAMEPPPLGQELKPRLKQITDTAALWSSNIEHWTQAQEALNNAQTLEDYLSRLAQLVQSPFATDAQKEAVSEIDPLKINRQTLLGELLLPENRAAWDSLVHPADWLTALMPQQPTPQEKNTYFNLRDDPNIENIYVYQLVANGRRNNPFHSHIVYVRGSLARNSAGQMSGLVYDPEEYHDTSAFLSNSYSEWNYSDVIKSNRLAECDSFERLRLGELIDPNTGNYQIPILQLFDQLNRDDNSSPLFRAYVTLKLFDLAELRPNQWGMQWCPAARTHLQTLKDLGAVDLKSGDWMVIGQVAKYQDAFKTYFQRARNVPLEKEALLLQQLAQQVCQAGFTYAGYVDADGRPVLHPSNGGAHEFWGWGGAAQSAVLLLWRDENGGAFEQVAHPLPFTPLFVFNGDRRGLLNDAARSVDYPESQMAGILPPFFSGLHE